MGPRRIGRGTLDLSLAALQNEGMNFPDVSHRLAAGRWAVLAFTVACLGSAAARGQSSEAALRFHGTGAGQQDRARIAIDDNSPGPDTSAPCDVGDGSFTIEFWLRGELADNGTLNDGGDNESNDIRWINGNILVDRDIFGGSDRDWGISVAGGFIRFGTARGDAPDQDAGDHTMEGNINVLDGQWHHVACVRNAKTGRKRIFVDGALDYATGLGVSSADISYPAEGVAGQATPWGPYIVLGAEKHDAGPEYPSFNGFMDELRIWSVARTHAEILESYDRVIDEATAGLVGYYRFEEGSGTVLGDSSAALSPDGELIAGVPGNGEWALASADADNAAPLFGGGLPAGFTKATIISDLNEPTVIEFAPDGRLFVGERGGRILVYENSQLLPTPLIQLSPDTDGERGLVGMALHPDFASNGYLYCYYTTTEPRNRVSRFTVTGNTANPASETLIWQNMNTAYVFHHGGCIEFGPDGNLYIATGDQFNSDAPQDLTRHHGKLLRVEPDGGIPGDNPYLGVPDSRPEIWAIGLRNPFRFSFDEATGAMYVGNVGGNSFNSWEELNLGAAAGNYGWPNQEGPECFTSDCSAYAFPFFTYQHNDPTYNNGADQGSITVGPRYRATQFPQEYQGNLFIGDYANRWIRRLVLDESGAVIATPVFLDVDEAGTIVDMEVGPDGSLYYVTIGLAWSGAPDVAGVHRISYTTVGNQPPSVVAGADPQTGAAPLLVSFSSAGTFDPDSTPAPLTYLWTFGDGGTSTNANPQHTYAQNGMYAAVLTVSDGESQAASQPIDIIVGNPPVAEISQPTESLIYRAGDTIFFSGSAMDVEDGVLEPSALSWRVLLRHLNHAHPYLGPITGTDGGSFIVPTTGHEPADTYYEIELNVTDSDGLTDVRSRPIYPEVSPLTLSTEPAGIPVFLDGVAVNTPIVYDSITNFEHEIEAQRWFDVDGTTYVFQCWSDAGARTHSLTMPAGGLELTAVYAAQTPEIWTVEVPANNRNADWYPSQGQEFANLYDATGLCCGRDEGGAYEMGLHFSLPIPQGATVLSAELQVVATADQAGSPIATIYGYDVGSAPSFDDASATMLTEHAPLTKESVAWALPTFSTDQEYSSPDISPIVQEIVDRTDWSEGSFVGIVVEPSATAVGQWRCIRNYASGLPAMLRVRFVLPGDEQACADPCPADIAPQPDGDESVTIADVISVITAFGPCPAPPDTCPQDIAPQGGDDLVTIADVIQVITAFGPCD